MLRIAAIAICLSFATIAVAEEKPAEKEYKGKVTCAKCELKVEGVTKCATVIKVKEGDKDIVYYFDADAHKKYHAAVCTEGKEGAVTGVAKKDGKKWVIKVAKVDYK